MQTSDRWSLPIAAWLGLCLALAYLPDIGHGFVADDFRWIAESRPGGWRELGRLLITAPTSFYRPVVSLSFALNDRLTGFAPLGYAIVNVGLAVAVAAALVALCRARGFTTIEGLFAAGVWIFNIHGVGMALTWISGRTSLLATLFATLAATALVRGRPWWTAAWTALALGSKEEVLPLVPLLTAWAILAHRRDDTGDIVRPWRASLAAAWQATWPCWAALAAYAVVRSQSGAMTLATAPPYYRLSAHWTVLLPNLAEYADRALTFATALVLLTTVIVWQWPRHEDVRAHERATLVDGALWLVLAFGLSILVPVRSDLYVVFPSIGAALMAAAAWSPLVRIASLHRRQAALALALLLPLLLWPVYHGRNAPARHEAELSTRVLQRAIGILRERPDLARIEVYQARDERPSIAAAFGDSLAPALERLLGRRIDAEVVLTAPSDPWPPSRGDTVRLSVVGDDVAAIAPPAP